MKMSRVSVAAALVCLFPLVAIAEDGSETKASSASVISANTAAARVLFEDPMTGDWRENWFLDGKEATLRNGADGLYFAGGTITKAMDAVKYHAHHAVLWTKQEFAGDIRISFEMTRKDDGDGATLLYIQARGVGRPPYAKDIREWSSLREIPAMPEYFNHMDLLSISLREDLRLRRYPWNDKEGNAYPENGLVEPKVDWPRMAPGDSYFVVVEKRNPLLTLRMYGKDREKPAVDHTWDMTKACEGRDPQWINEGRIGLRHMATRQLVYKNFRVAQLGATDDASSR
jgi:hypothetical protein